MKIGILQKLAVFNQWGVCEISTIGKVRFIYIISHGLMSAFPFPFCFREETSKVHLSIINTPFKKEKLWQLFESLDYLPSHSTVYKHWLKRQPAR